MVTKKKAATQRATANKERPLCPFAYPFVARPLASSFDHDGEKENHLINYIISIVLITRVFERKRSRSE